MIVCICKSVNDKKILDSIDNGSSSIEDIQVKTNACTQCGKCKKVITQMIATHRNELDLEPIDRIQAIRL